ncbi:MAG: sulfatase-like hydrolase/transferase, partial [Bacteroidales bacterium]|nr:sulfatase-like hydrolase/transferase [Bacteroidales bacterium]
YSLFNRGVLYDINVSSFALFIPFVFLSLGALFSKTSKVFNLLSRYYLYIMLTLILAIYAADMPFFDYYNARLTKAVFSWTDHPLLMIKTLFSYKSYLVYILLFMVSASAVVFWIRFLYRKIILKNPVRKIKTYEPVCLLAGLFLILTGMRGEFRLHYKPLLPEHALFSPYSFANQLGMNPVYSFAESYSVNNINYLDDKVAVEKSCHYLNITPTYNSPIARNVVFNDTLVKRNVVIILMESMSASVMGLNGNTDNLCPFLDSLAMENIYFENIYTDGIHTYNGVFSSLFGLPSILEFKPTKTPHTVSLEYSGISNVLSPHGYKMLYYCNGDKNFDNMDFFLRRNCFDEVVSQENFAEEEIYDSWGVTDLTMFSSSIARMNEMHQEKQPFVSVIMTISAHEGYIPPPGVYKSNENQKQAYECADHALRCFFNEASEQGWYKNTVFLLVADHGQSFDRTYDLSLSYFHSPMVIVAPFLNEKRHYKKIGLQLDAMPTIMGVLKIPYINNTLGIDLRNESRPFAYFSSDNKIGCLNEQFFLVIRKNGVESLYKYANRDLVNYLEQYPDVADSMRAYVYSMYQTTQYLINSKKTALPVFAKQTE